MRSIYQNILEAGSKSIELLAVLIDPDKMKVEAVPPFVARVNNSTASHIFIGGSDVPVGLTERLVSEIKANTDLPVILFPGDVTQITDEADGILFLSLISGRNPEFLIGKHVEAVSRLNTSKLEVLPTGYVLIENGKPTSVERVSQTTPLKRNAVQTIIDTAKAG